MAGATRRPVHAKRTMHGGWFAQLSEHRAGGSRTPLDDRVKLIERGGVLAEPY